MLIFTPLVALGEDQTTQRWFYQGSVDQVICYQWADVASTHIWSWSCRNAARRLADVCRNVRDGKRTCQTAGPYLCPGGDFSSGQIAACSSLNGFATVIVTEWGHGWYRRWMWTDIHTHSTHQPVAFRMSHLAAEQKCRQRCSERLLSANRSKVKTLNHSKCVFLGRFYMPDVYHGDSMLCNGEVFFLNNFSSATINHTPHSLPPFMIIPPPPQVQIPWEISMGEEFHLIIAPKRDLGFSIYRIFVHFLHCNFKKWGKTWTHLSNLHKSMCEHSEL